MKTSLMMNTTNNTSPANPYDELPYCAYPIEWLLHHQSIELRCI
jgi:hypothetical protein